MYLIKGTERALLIDTGMGIGNLKGHVEELTQLPYDVVLTHGHCDHAGGAVQFPEVYLSEADWDLEKKHATLEHRIQEYSMASINRKALPRICYCRSGLILSCHWMNQ